jgi:hypothetical protein
LGVFKDILQRLCTCFKRNNDPHIRDLIIQACRKTTPPNGTRDSFLGEIAIAAIVIADQDLFRDAVHLVVDGFDESAFYTLGGLTCFQALVVPEDE